MSCKGLVALENLRLGVDVLVLAFGKTTPWWSQGGR